MSYRILSGRRTAMSGRWLAAAATLSMAACLSGADIKGTITVKQRLTRPSVTASVSVYERGPVVELGKIPWVIRSLTKERESSFGWRVTMSARIPHPRRPRTCRRSIGVSTPTSL